MFIRIFLIILITLISGACTEYSSEWHAILDQDINHSWRNESTNKYIKTNGDFNGDGLIDSAKLQINKSKSLVRLIVYIKSLNKEVTPYILDEQNIEFLNKLGIRSVNPGNYEISCELVRGPCEGKSLILNVPTMSIEYFYYDGAACYFIWNSNGFYYQTIFD
jgi:hypothetical protein